MPAPRLIALLLAAAACGGDDFTPTLAEPTGVSGAYTLRIDGPG